jgi:hypothetical protein
MLNETWLTSFNPGYVAEESIYFGRNSWKTFLPPLWGKDRMGGMKWLKAMTKILPHLPLTLTLSRKGRGDAL